MKKYILGVFFLSLLFVVMQSCEKETTAGYTSITVYPVIKLNGEPTVFINLGEDFDDPKASASLDGNDVSNDLVISSTINKNKTGKYSVNYSMTNADGFKVEQTRSVYVIDPTPSVISSGIYTVQAGSNRNGTTSYSGYPIVIYQLSPGVFSISDFLGGYYDKRAGYGSAYAAKGSFKLLGDNTLQLVSSSVEGWGDELDELKNGKYDPANGTISFTAAYAGAYDFNVILKK